ncbi:MAG: RDD family protein [Flavobacteriales bacterium]|nr:RDD family protein [Flavobacteriales bacterium]
MVTKNHRLVNYLLDTIVYTILLRVLTVLPIEFTHYYLFPALLYFLYYFIMELTLSQTVGKLLTGTKVVSSRNTRTNVLHIFMRTLLRFATPLDSFSYLMGKEQGIHDVLSRTRLVKP